MAAGLLAAGVQPIAKHAPGHGRALVDSHLSLPRVEANHLDADLLPFALNADLPWAMSAHIVYPAWDAALPATLSPTVIAAIIRGRIGFEGVLVTDDLAMKALSGAPADLARQALAAGCDIALYCSGEFAPTAELLAHCPPLTDGRDGAPRGRSRRSPRDGACRSTRRRWPPNGIGCWRDRHRPSACPGRDPGDPGDHPARGGAWLCGAGAGRRHGAAGRAAVAQSAAPCRSGGHHPAAGLPADLPAADHPPGGVHVRLGQAGAGVGLEVPRSAPRHGAGGGRRPGDELLPRLGGGAAAAGAAGDGRCQHGLPGRRDRAEPAGRVVPVLLHADQPGARPVQPAADPAAGRRPHRGRPAAARAGASLGAGWSATASCW